MKKSIISSACLFFSLAISSSYANVLQAAIEKSHTITLQSKSTQLCAAAGNIGSGYSGKPILQKTCNHRDGQRWQIIEKNHSHIPEPQFSQLKSAYLKAGQGWIDAFNSGDANAVASFYEDDAVMHVKSKLDFGGVEVAGVQRGIDTIEGFYAIGFDHFNLTDVRYIEPQVTFVDEKTVFVSSYFVQNNIGGYIDAEVWVMQDDGTMKLRYDEFSIRYFKNH